LNYHSLTQSQDLPNRAHLFGGLSGKKGLGDASERQRSVDNPAKRLDASSSQVVLQSLRFVNGRWFWKRDENYFRELRVSKPGEQLLNRLWGVTLRPCYFSVIRFGRVHQ
jgi:hypothetical protein